jgi:ribosome-binding protein aMBF1 (putative translation factor)
VIEINPDAIPHYLAKLAPTAANRSADDSPSGESRVIFCDLADPAHLADFARQVCGARGLLDWSQARLAREAGVNLRTLQRLEKAQGTPVESTVSRVHEALVSAGIQLIGDSKRVIGVVLQR